MSNSKMKNFIFKNKHYTTLSELRLAMPNVVFPKEPSEELLQSLGVTVEEYIPSEEEILAQAKAERAKAVANIKVTVDGMVFDGDETAQTRMGRTIAAAQALGVDSSEKRTWVLADNTVAEPTIAQLAQALKLAGDEQTRLWTVPYEEQKTEDLGLAKVGI